MSDSSLGNAIIILAVSAALMAVIAACAMAGYHTFLSLEGLLIVVGGTIANAFLSFKKADVLSAFETMGVMLKKTPENDGMKQDLLSVVSWAYVVQEKDLLGLEKETKDVRDPLLRYGIDLVVTGYDINAVRQMMENAIEADFERRCAPVTVLRNMAAAAPAFGMVGTLVGMAVLLQGAGRDVTQVSSGLGIAMMATLYGILIARLLCLPAADKLLTREEARRFRNYMMAEGLAMLAAKQNPLYVQDRLNSFLDPSQHFDFHKIARARSRRLAVAA